MAVHARIGVVQLLAIMAPECGCGGAIVRNLPFTAGARKRHHIDFGAARLPRVVGQPAPIGRKRASELVHEIPADSKSPGAEGGPYDQPHQALYAKDVNALMSNVAPDVVSFDVVKPLRSEERRVGKAWRSWGSTYE